MTLVFIHGFMDKIVGRYLVESSHSWGGGGVGVLKECAFQKNLFLEFNDKAINSFHKGQSSCLSFITSITPTQS